MDNILLLKQKEKELKSFIKSNARIWNFAPNFILKKGESLMAEVENLRKLVAKESHNV